MSTKQGGCFLKAERCQLAKHRVEGTQDSVLSKAIALHPGACCNIHPPKNGLPVWLRGPRWTTGLLLLKCQKRYQVRAAAGACYTS